MWTISDLFSSIRVESLFSNGEFDETFFLTSLKSIWGELQSRAVQNFSWYRVEKFLIVGWCCLSSLTRKSRHREFDWCRMDLQSRLIRSGCLILKNCWVQVLLKSWCAAFWDQPVDPVLKCWISLETIWISWWLRPFLRTFEVVAPPLIFQRDSSFRLTWRGFPKS